MAIAFTHTLGANGSIVMVNGKTLDLAALMIRNSGDVAVNKKGETAYR